MVHCLILLQMGSGVLCVYLCAVISRKTQVRVMHTFSLEVVFV